MQIFLDNVAQPDAIQKDHKGQPKKVKHNGAEYVLVARNTEKNSKILSYLKLYGFALTILFSGGLVTLFEKFRNLLQDNLTIIRSGEKKIYTYHLIEAKKEKTAEEKNAEKDAEKTAEKTASVAAAAATSS